MTAVVTADKLAAAQLHARAARCGHPQAVTHIADTAPPAVPVLERSGWHQALAIARQGGWLLLPYIDADQRGVAARAAASSGAGLCVGGDHLSEPSADVTPYRVRQRQHHSAVLFAIRWLRNRGLSWSGVAEALNGGGYPLTRGGPWTYNRARDVGLVDVRQAEHGVAHAQLRCRVLRTVVRPGGVAVAYDTPPLMGPRARSMWVPARPVLAWANERGLIELRLLPSQRWCDERPYRVLVDGRELGRVVMPDRDVWWSDLGPGPAGTLADPDLDTPRLW